MVHCLSQRKRKKLLIARSVVWLALVSMRHVALPVQESVVYELSMVVAHVRESWMEAPGNLVAHIRVSPFYHARKQVTTLCTI